MKRLLKKSAYKTVSPMEKIIGYLVTRRSGLKLEKHHFDEIIEHFESNGGHLEGIQGKNNHNSDHYYEKLHNSIDHVLIKYDMK